MYIPASQATGSVHFALQDLVYSFIHFEPALVPEPIDCDLSRLRIGRS